MKKLARIFLIAAFLTPIVTLPVKAEPGRRYDGDRHYRNFSHDHRFHDSRWHRGWHDGRFGWWWVSGPAWSYYPVYPAVTYRYHPVPVYYRPVYVAQPVSAAPFFGLSFSFR